MFLRAKVRRKDGKEHRTFSIVENRRVSGGRVVQRHVLYLGEINDSQALGWRKSIEAFEDGATRPRTMALFPDDRCDGVLDDDSIVRLKLKQLRLTRPRTFGACRLALRLWRELELDEFWRGRLPASRKGTRWDEVCSCWWLTGCSRRAANGGCTAPGSSAARSPICWAPMLA
ncbi:MAG: hypothetical protein ACREFU_15665, partial [Acetobacteraceae bacterium]